MSRRGKGVQLDVMIPKWLLIVCRAINTIMALQHPFGGFAGGPGQFPHLLPTYASVCALAIAGRKGDNGGWDQIDRCVYALFSMVYRRTDPSSKKMYGFFMSLKQPDGSFLVSHHGEVDVRYGTPL